MAYEKDNWLLSNLGEYRKLQDVYLNKIHMSDYREAKEQWDATLYIPLQRFVKHALSSYFKNEDRLHMVYIGAGPHIPLFFVPTLRSDLLARIEEITFVDVSQKCLAHTEKLFARNASDKCVNTLCADVTSGLGDEFARSLHGVLIENDTPDEILAALQCMQHDEGKYVGKTACQKRCDKLDVRGDFIYSEMVATFTGTAAMLAFECELLHRFAKQSNVQILVNELMQRATQIWQAYNEIAYREQMTMMVSMAREDGLIGVVADTIKIYQSANLPNVTSFRGESFPQIRPFSCLKEIKTGFNEEIIWDDERRAASTLGERNIPGALQPHRHRIDFVTYVRTES